MEEMNIAGAPLACPFCGHEFDRLGYNGQPATSWYVGCKCEARGPVVYGDLPYAANQAILLWNTRKEKK